MYCRGVRGATTIEENTSEAILRGTQELLTLTIRRNGIQPEDAASVIFTVTHDPGAEFPATAARQSGRSNVTLVSGSAGIFHPHRIYVHDCILQYGQGNQCAPAYRSQRHNVVRMTPDTPGFSSVRIPGPIRWFRKIVQTHHRSTVFPVFVVLPIFSGRKRKLYREIVQTHQ